MLGWEFIVFERLWEQIVNLSGLVYKTFIPQGTILGLLFS